MSSFQLTPEAEEDLFSIWAYIRSDNADAADHVERAIYKACDFLASSPYAGHTRSDLTSKAVRFWVVRRFSSYVIVYDPARQPLAILRILHSARDLKREMRSS